MNKFCFPSHLGAIALGSFLFISATSVESAAAANVTSSLPGTIDLSGGSFSVTFNQDSTGSTTFNQVFPSGSLSFNDYSSAKAAVDAILNILEQQNTAGTPFDFLPAPNASTGTFAVPYALENGNYEAVTGQVVITSMMTSFTSSGDPDLLGFSNAKAVDAPFSGGFVTLAPAAVPGAAATTVPTPALLPGLLGLGASIMRKRRQANPGSIAENAAA